MSFYRIEGGRPLSGSLSVQGAKNSVLPILAAAVLAPGQSVIHNCPDLSDVSATLDILRLLGCRTEREGDTVLVDASALCRSDIPDRLMREMRSSVIFLGALLARLGEAELTYPGGCELGPPAIDLHLSALRRLGAEIREDQGCLRCQGGGALRGRELCLNLPSVGATENAMLAACGLSGGHLDPRRRPRAGNCGPARVSAGYGGGGVGGRDLGYHYPGRRAAPSGGALRHGGPDRGGYISMRGGRPPGGEVELTRAEPQTLTAVLSALEEAAAA